MRGIVRTNIGIAAFLLAVLASSYAAAEGGDFLITATAGLTVPTGDIGSDLVGPGFVLGGLAHVGLTDRLYLGGGGHFAILGGQDSLGTDGGVNFTFEGGAVFYFVPRVETNKIRPYIAGYAGWGLLGWSFQNGMTLVDGNGNTKTIDSDSNGFLFVAPEVGIDILVSEYASIVAGARLLLATYGDTTHEDLKFDLDGGSYVDVFVGLAFTL